MMTPQDSLLNALDRSNPTIAKTDRPDRDGALGAVIDQVVQRFRSGEKIDIQQIVADNPDLAKELQEVLPIVLALEPVPNSLDHASPESKARLADASGSKFDKTDSQPAEETGARFRAGHLGEYRIIRELGRGGMGVVYEAWQQSLDRVVALKVLPLAGLLDERQIQRFRNEARAAAGLQHPNIVPVYAVGQEQGVHYYAMQLIDGPSLAEVIANRRKQSAQHVKGSQVSPDNPLPPTVLVDRLVELREADGDQDVGSSDRLSGLNVSAPLPTPPATQVETEPQARLETHPMDTSTMGNRDWITVVAKWGVQLAEALEYAHRVGVLHRDIKPGNILLDAGGSVWITDFGLARLESDAGVTLTGDLLGTLRYMSPEQANGNRGMVDQRSDVYSLGITLYELFVLQPAFAGVKRGELLQQLLESDPVRPRQLNSAIPYDLETILLKATNKDPASRYESAEGLADDLRRFLEDHPIRARRPGWLRVATLWSRRHKAIVTTAVTSLLILAMALGTILWQSQRLAGEVAANVNAAIASTQTALSANDLKLAGQKLAEAEGALGSYATRFPDQAATLVKLATEIEQNELAAHRYQQLLKLAREAQDKMIYSNDGMGEAAALDTLALVGLRLGKDDKVDYDSIAADARTATELASQLFDTTDGGLSYYTPEQKQRVQETIYETLLCLASVGTRWKNQRTEERVRESLKYLELAQEFHPATRGYYLVRSGCHFLLGEFAKEDADLELYDRTPARFALDYYLPAESMESVGNVEGALAAYQAALDLQPDNYNSLYFMAKLLAKLDRREEAILAYRACIALRPFESVVARRRCAQMLRILGRLQEAEHLWISAVEIAKREWGVTDKRTILLSKELAHWYFSQEQYSDAERVFKETLEWVDANPNLTPELDAELMGLIGDLGSTYRIQQRFAEAEEMHHQVLDAYRSLQGEEHLDTLIARSNLALLYSDMNRRDEAEAIYRELIPIQERVLGEHHLFTLVSHFNFATIHLDSNRLAEAEKIYLRIIEPMQKARGEIDHYTLEVKKRLGGLYSDQGRYPEAESLLREAWDGYQRIFEKNSPSKIQAGFRLAQVLRLQDKSAEAELIFRDLLEILRSRYGENRPETMQVKNSLAVLFTSQQRYQEAIEFHRQILDVRQRVLGERHFHTLTTMNNLASNFHELGEYEKARDLLEKVREKFPAGPESQLLRLYTLFNLGNTYTCLEQHAKAEKMYQDALDKNQRHLEDQHPLVLSIRLALGLNQLAQEKLLDAEQLIDEVRKDRVATLGQENQTTIRSIDHLARVYLKQHRYTDARDLLMSRANQFPYLENESDWEQLSFTQQWHWAHAETLLGMALLGLEEFNEAEGHLINGYEKLKTMEDRLILEARKYLPEAVEAIIRLYDILEQEESSERWQAILDEHQASD